MNHVRVLGNDDLKRPIMESSMDYRFIVVESDGTECVYEHIHRILKVRDFKFGMEVCVVQNGDTMDFWAIDENDVAAQESLVKFYHDQYGWDFYKMNYRTFRAAL